MAEYNKIKVAITQQNNIDMATYKHNYKPIGIIRNYSQNLYPLDILFGVYPFIFNKLTLCIKIFIISMPHCQKLIVPLRPFKN